MGMAICPAKTNLRDLELSDLPRVRLFDSGSIGETICSANICVAWLQPSRSGAPKLAADHSVSGASAERKCRRSVRLLAGPEHRRSRTDLDVWRCGAVGLESWGASQASIKLRHGRGGPADWGVSLARCCRGKTRRATNRFCIHCKVAHTSCRCRVASALCDRSCKRYFSNRICGRRLGVPDSPSRYGLLGSLLPPNRVSRHSGNIGYAFRNLIGICAKTVR